MVPLKRALYMLEPAGIALLVILLFLVALAGFLVDRSQPQT